MPAPDPLKLIALDADDLAVISAHVQDARVQASDIVWRQDEKRLVVGMIRLDWEQTLSGGTEPRRSIAALRFDRVLACKSRNIDLAQPEAVLELVGIEFHPGEAPGGSALLLFSHGEALRLDVECLECELTDLGTDDLGTSDLAMAPLGPEGESGAVGGQRRVYRAVPTIFTAGESHYRDGAARVAQPTATGPVSGRQGLTALGRRAIEQGPFAVSQKATMPVRLDTSSADFGPLFKQFLAAKREVSADVERATRAIVDDVAARGDAALLEATQEIRPARHRTPPACA